MQNQLPVKQNELFTLAEDMADGLNTHQNSIGVKHNTQSLLRDTLASAQLAQADYATSVAARNAVNRNVTVASANAKTFIAAARGVLVNYLGNSWSQNWEPTGFPDHCTAVPDTQSSRQALLASLKAYFTSHPEQENPPLNVTAERAGTLFHALSDARSALNQSWTVSGEKKTVRDSAAAALRERMRSLIDELSILLSDLDARWLAFGLNQPGAPEMPEAPEDLVLRVAMPGVVMAQWTGALRADRYRVFKKVDGRDTGFMFVGTVHDTDATITDVPAGSTVHVRVTSVNQKNAESAPSEEVQIAA